MDGRGLGWAGLGWARLGWRWEWMVGVDGGSGGCKEMVGVEGVRGW
jgi:hypothetical protein